MVGAVPNFLIACRRQFVKFFNLTWSAAFAATILFAGVAAAKNDNTDNLKNAGNGRLKVLNSGGKSRDQRRFEPFHSTYVVLPGDSLPVISLKEYGTSDNAKFIARFNRFPESQALRLNQVLALPSIGAHGQLSQSRAPAADSPQQSTTASGSPGCSNNGTSTFPTTSTSGFPTASGSDFPGQLAGTTNTLAKTAPAPIVNPTPAASLSRIAVGSTLLVDAAQFGDQAGTAQLRIGNAPVTVDVLEWTASAIKVRLPQLQLAAASTADLLIMRADGTAASKTSIELIAAPRVALAK